MTIRAVLFDLGHTLWDITPQPQALAAAYVEMRDTLSTRLGRSDLPAAAVFQAAVRDVLVAASETYFSGDAGLLQRAEHLQQPPSTHWIDRGCRSLGIELDEELLREVTPPMFATEIDGLVCAPGTAEALGSLAAQGYRLGCITNTLADSAAIRAMLRMHDLDRLMETVIVSADEGWRKPHASLFEKALRELDVPAAESVFIGDSPVHDIAGAKAAGMRAILTCQYASRPYRDYRPLPDAIIQHLDELDGALCALNAASREGDHSTPAPAD